MTTTVNPEMRLGGDTESSDVSTVISILPFSPPLEKKPGLFPGEFKIPAGSIDKPGVLHVPTCYYGVYQIDWKSIRVPEPSKVVANSIVRDYIAALPCISYGDGDRPAALPGLLWREGRLTPKAITEAYEEDLITILGYQNQWFKNLVDMADDDFAKYGVKRAISDLQKFAARALHLNKPWLNEIKMAQCPGCAQPVAAAAAICPLCRTIVNEELYSKLKKAV